MQVIVPKPITDAVLASSTVAEADYPAWNSATAYAVGDHCILASVHRVYKCLTAHTNKQPDTDVASVTPSWQEVGYTNRWRMFDPYVNTLTTKSDGIQVVLDASSCDSVALFNLSGSDVLLELLVDEEVVFSQSITLATRSVGSWYDWFFTEFDTVADVRAKFPVYYSAQLRITVGGDAACGNVVVGRTRDIGSSLYEPTVGLLDYSRKVTDANFGNTFLQQGAFSKRTSVPVEVRSNRVDYVFKTLAALRGRPAVWLCDNGQPTFECMQVYGFYRDFNIVISGPVMSQCSLEIEGLI